MKKVAVIGGGIIGSSWAIVFARAGIQTSVYDESSYALQKAKDYIKDGLNNSRKLLKGNASIESVLNNITFHSSLSECVCQADYVQESVSESLQIKKNIFTALDEMTSDDVILASSTSTYTASSFTQNLLNPQRCLVVHPMTPPHLMPVIELVRSKWTTSEVTQKVRDFMLFLGQKPILLKKELSSFALNRIQGTLLIEIFKLISDGVIEPEDADIILSHGLGLRWSVMGPLEGIDLNAPTGIKGYLERYGHIFNDIAQEKGIQMPISSELVNTLHEAMRKMTSLEDLDKKRLWRDEVVTEVRLKVEAMR